MKVYALVGKSGTGKSFQAMSLCRKMNIPAIIDDGLLISEGQILAGISAKRQDTKIGAVKTALFSKDDHREAVVLEIANTRPESILIIGTSDKMVFQIGERLGLPAIEKTIYIEDITSENDREIAKKQRNELGKHVIPVPTFELKKDFSGYFLDTLKNFKVWGQKDATAEKSVVRPTYSYLGEYTIAGKVIDELIKYAARDIEEVISIPKISTRTTGEGMVINITAFFEYGISIPMVARRLQQLVVSRVSLMTAFNIVEVNIEAKVARRII